MCKVKSCHHMSAQLKELRLYNPREKYRSFPKSLCFSCHTCTTTSCQTAVGCSLPTMFRYNFVHESAGIFFFKTVFNQYVLSSLGGRLRQAKQMAEPTMLPLFPQFSCLSENDLPVTEHNLAPHHHHHRHP